MTPLHTSKSPMPPVHYTHLRFLTVSFLVSLTTSLSGIIHEAPRPNPITIIEGASSWRASGADKIQGILCAGEVDDQFAVFTNEQLLLSSNGLDWAVAPFPTERTLINGGFSAGETLLYMSDDQSASARYLYSYGNGINYDLRTLPLISSEANLEFSETQIILHGTDLQGVPIEYVSFNAGRTWIDSGTIGAPVSDIPTTSNTATGNGLTLQQVVYANPIQLPNESYRELTDVYSILADNQRTLLATIDYGLGDILFGNGVFVATHYTKRDAFYASTDGVTWQKADDMMTGPNNWFFFEAGVFHYTVNYFDLYNPVVPIGTHKVSTDGINWSEAEKPYYSSVKRLSSEGVTLETRDWGTPGTAMGGALVYRINQSGETLELVIRGANPTFVSTSAGFLYTTKGGSLYFRLHDQSYLPSVNGFTGTRDEDLREITMSWQTLDNAASYHIYESTDSLAKLVGETNGTSFTATDFGSKKHFSYFEWRAMGDDVTPYTLAGSDTHSFFVRAVDTTGREGIESYSISTSFTVEVETADDVFGGVFGDGNVVPDSNYDYASNQIYGYFYARAFPWAYSSTLGWVYNAPVEGDIGHAVWLYRMDRGWHYTRDDWYPFLYEFQGDTWIWVATNTGQWYRFNGDGSWSEIVVSK